MISTCFLFFCWFPPAPAVPDGAGGYVPFTNSRVMPDGSLWPYDPAIDGMPSTGPYGPYPSIVPMPGAPVDFPDLAEGPGPPPDFAYPNGNAAPDQDYPPQPSYAPPAHRHNRAAPSRLSCYDGNGKFNGADNDECR